MSNNVANRISVNKSAAMQQMRAKFKDLIGERDEVLAQCRAYLDQYLDALRSKFEAGEIGGLAAAEQRAQIFDDLLAALFVYADETQFPDPNRELSLCAVGGYGRGEMAPFSDLDILFLYPGSTSREDCADVVEYILYMLWDLGLKIGHAHRTPEECMQLGKADDTILTALLDLRLLAGEKRPANELATLFRRYRSRATSKKYVAAKLAARDARHEKAGNSRYVIEPNIKEGKGGLRDLHELYWIARFVYGGKGKSTDVPTRPHQVKAYVRHGVLAEPAVERFSEAAEFLWDVRTHLHYLSGRANEVLSFDKQDALAKRMGFDQDYPDERVELFMQDYFKTAREVGALTRIVCARLESQSQLLLPQGLYRFLPSRGRGLKQPGFAIEAGRLNFANKKTLTKKPELMLKLFLIAGKRNLDIHPESFAAIRDNIGQIDDDFIRDANNIDLFFKVVLDVDSPGTTLMAMNESGVLGAFLPEFGSIVGRTQFNMHHAFTVDDHTINLIKNLHDIEEGEHVRAHPLTSGFAKNWNRRTRLMLYLACLLHDTGKGKGDQCEEGAILAVQACTRMGLDDADTETVAWLVRNHLVMSETAQRRDISDPDTIERFVGIVGSVKRLQMLTALTVVDIRSVGPGIWNDWKGELLRQLYDAARHKLLLGVQGGSDDMNPVTEFQDALLAALSPEDAVLTEGIIRDLPANYWQNYNLEASKSHAAFFAKAAKKNTKHHTNAHVIRKRDITELWVLTEDREHLFADLAGVIATAGASVVGALLHTGDNGTVFNVFYIQNIQGLAYGRKNPQRRKTIEATCLKAAKGGAVKVKIPERLASRRADAIPVNARVSIMNSKVGEKIIEVEGRDRVGLLFELTQVFSKFYLSIRSAHIDVMGPTAVDAFYISYDQKKPFDPFLLRAELSATLSDFQKGHS